MSKSESMNRVRRIALYSSFGALVRYSSCVRLAVALRRRVLRHFPGPGYWICRESLNRSKKWIVMFTGLIEEVGSVISVSAASDGTELKIAAPYLAKKMRRGDSVAVNGCCLTLNSHHRNALGFDLLAETIARTNQKHLQRGDSVNLERALGAKERFGGHFVQGHVDCVSPVLAFQKSGPDFRL